MQAVLPNKHTNESIPLQHHATCAGCLHSKHSTAPTCFCTWKKLFRSVHSRIACESKTVTHCKHLRPMFTRMTWGCRRSFFCAMDPEMRNQWGDAWAHWLKPGGVLVTLMFPVEEEGRQGPPWPVPTDLYHKYLEPHGRPSPHCNCMTLWPRFCSPREEPFTAANNL